MPRLVSAWRFYRVEPDAEDSYWERSGGPFTMYVDEQKPRRVRGWVTGADCNEIESLSVKARSIDEAKCLVRNRLHRHMMRMIKGIFT